MAFLQDVFKDSGVPTYTFVEPNEYIKIVVTLSTKGRCLVVEGPSGIGKTTCVLKALEYLGMGDSIQLLTPRKKKDILSIEKILDNNKNRITLQCVFHSIRFKVNKKIGCLGEIAFFYGI